MLYKEISRVLAPYLFCLAGALVLACLLAGYYQFIADPATHPQPGAFWAFLITLGICLVLACLFWLGGRNAKGTLYHREGLALVVVIWFITALIGAVPFTLSHTFSNPLNSYFEAMSGLTTTGATLMTPKQYNQAGEEIPIVKRFVGELGKTYTFPGTIEPVRDESGKIILEGIPAVNKALLLWRSFLQWIGGMGIVVLFLAILPALGAGGKVLYQAEVPGPIKDAMTPRIKDTAGKLWKLYLGLSILEVILLLATNAKMALFDAVAITFSTISTGGFTVTNHSIASYANPATEWVIIAFMFLGSVNFVLYAYILRRKFSRLLDAELWIYVGWLIIAIILIVALLVGTRELLLPPDYLTDKTFSLSEAIRFGTFQLISVQTSTGFATADFNFWPYAVQVLLLSVMFIGGMSGSTAGGIKVIRHTVLVRTALQKIERIFRPQTVRTLRIGKSFVDEERATTVLVFFFIVIACALIGTFLLVLDGLDPETALTTNGCMLNNIGIAFRMGGPNESFAFLPEWGKVISIIWMVLGRLEYFAVLVLLIPAFWRRTV